MKNDKEKFKTGFTHHAYHAKNLFLLHCRFYLFIFPFYFFPRNSKRVFDADARLSHSERNVHTCGFTLIEVLIATAIFAIIASALIGQNRVFQSNVETGNLAYEIALAIREAQVLGLGVRQFGGAFTEAYGIHFEEPNVNSLSFVLFLDRTPPASSVANLRYDGPVVDPTVETFELRGGNRIVELRGTRDTNVIDCRVLGGGGDCGGSLRWIDIVFRRPDPAANIRIKLPPPTPFIGVRASVRIQSLGGIDYTVEVTDTGQISVRR